MMSIRVREGKGIRGGGGVGGRVVVVSCNFFCAFLSPWA